MRGAHEGNDGRDARPTQLGIDKRSSLEYDTANMRFRLLAFLPTILLFAGCSSLNSQVRFAALHELSAAPVSDAAWGRIVGNYSGPVRSRVHTWMGTTGEKSEELSLSIRGSALNPQVFIRIRSNYTTAWTGLGTKAEIFTNIPRLEYGAKPLKEVSSHAPDALVIEVSKRIYVLRFLCPENVDVDEIGIHGWRGSGRLMKIPEFPCAPANIGRN